MSLSKSTMYDTLKLALLLSLLSHTCNRPSGQRTIASHSPDEGSTLMAAISLRSLAQSACTLASAPLLTFVASGAPPALVVE